METACRTAAKIRRYSEVVKRRHLLALQRSSAHNTGIFTQAEPATERFRPWAGELQDIRRHIFDRSAKNRPALDQRAVVLRHMLTSQPRPAL